MKIAILGSNSHIAKSILKYLLNHEIRLFCSAMENYNEFGNEYYDMIINFSCPGSPKHIKESGKTLLNNIKKRESMILKYLANNDSLYVSMSSGIVHEPVKSPYKEAKVWLENSHRKHVKNNIVDLRLYSYFSRCIDLHSGHLMAEIVNCIKNNTIFNAISLDLVRDYIHPEDFSNILLGLSKENNVYDIGSKAPVSLGEILDYCSKEYGLKYREKYQDNGIHAGVNLQYYPKKVSFSPIDTSMGTIIDQLHCMLR